MSELYRCEEWQGASGIWYCEHTSSFPRNVQKWVVPARILGLTPADFLKLLIKFDKNQAKSLKRCREMRPIDYFELLLFKIFFLLT